MLRISSTYLASGNFLCTFCKRWRRDGRKFQVMSFTQDFNQRYITSCQNTVKWSMTRFPCLTNMRKASSYAANRIDIKYGKVRSSREPLSRQDGRSKAVVALFNQNDERGTRKDGDGIKRVNLQSRRKVSGESIARKSQKLIEQSNPQRLKNLEKYEKTVKIKSNFKILTGEDDWDESAKEMMERTKLKPVGSDAAWSKATSDKVDEAFTRFQEMISVPGSAELEQYLHEQDLRKKTTKAKKRSLSVFKVSDPYVRQRLNRNKVDSTIYDQSNLLREDEPQCEFAEVQCGKKRVYIAFLEDALSDKVKADAGPQPKPVKALQEEIMGLPPEKLKKMTPEKIVKMAQKKPLKEGIIVKMVQEKNRVAPLKLKLPKKSNNFKVTVNLKNPRNDMCPLVHFEEKTPDGPIGRTMKFQVKKMERYWFSTGNGRVRIQYLTGVLTNFRNRLRGKLEMPKLLKCPSGIPDETKVVFFHNADEVKAPGNGKERSLANLPADEHQKESITKKLKQPAPKNKESGDSKKEEEPQSMFNMLRRKGKKLDGEKKDDNKAEAPESGATTSTLGNIGKLMQGVVKPKTEQGKKAPEVRSKPPRLDTPLKPAGKGKETTSLKAEVSKKTAASDEKLLPPLKPKTITPAWKEIDKINKEKQAEQSRIPIPIVTDPYFAQLYRKKAEETTVRKESHKSVEKWQQDQPTGVIPDGVHQASQKGQEQQSVETQQPAGAFQHPVEEQQPEGAFQRQARTPNHSEVTPDWVTPPTTQPPEQQTIPPQEAQNASTYDGNQGYAPPQTEQPPAGYQWNPYVQGYSDMQPRQILQSPPQWTPQYQWNPQQMPYPSGQLSPTMLDHQQTWPQEAHQAQPQAQPTEAKAAQAEQEVTQEKQTQPPRNDFYYPDLGPKKTKPTKKPPTAEKTRRVSFSGIFRDGETFIPIQVKAPPFFKDIQMYDTQKELEETINKPIPEDDLPGNHWDNWRIPNLRKIVRAKASNAGHSFIIDSEVLAGSYSECAPDTSMEYNYNYDQEPTLRTFERAVAENFSRVDDADLMTVNGERKRKSEGEKSAVTIHSQQEKTPAFDNRITDGGKPSAQVVTTGVTRPEYLSNINQPASYTESLSEDFHSGHVFDSEALPNFVSYPLRMATAHWTTYQIATHQDVPETAPELITDSEASRSVTFQEGADTHTNEAKAPMAFVARSTNPNETANRTTKTPVGIPKPQTSNTTTNRQVAAQVKPEAQSPFPSTALSTATTLESRSSDRKDSQPVTSKQDRGDKEQPTGGVGYSGEITDKLGSGESGAKTCEELLRKLKNELSTKLKDQWKVKLFDELTDTVKPVVENKLMPEKARKQLFLLRTNTKSDAMKDQTPGRKQEEDDYYNKYSATPVMTFAEIQEKSIQPTVWSEGMLSGGTGFSAGPDWSQQEGFYLQMENKVSRETRSALNVTLKTVKEDDKKKSDSNPEKAPPVPHVPEKDHPYLPRKDIPGNPQKRDADHQPRPPKIFPHHKDHPYLPKWDQPPPKRETPVQPYHSPSNPYEPQTYPPSQPYYPFTQPNQPYQPQTNPPGVPYHPQTQPSTNPYNPQTQPPSQPQQPQTPCQPCQPQTYPPTEPYPPKTQPYYPQTQPPTHPNQPKTSPQQPAAPIYPRQEADLKEKTESPVTHAQTFTTKESEQILTAEQIAEEWKKYYEQLGQTANTVEVSDQSATTATGTEQRKQPDISQQRKEQVLEQNVSDVNRADEQSQVHFLKDNITPTKPEEQKTIEEITAGHAASDKKEEEKKNLATIRPDKTGPAQFVKYKEDLKKLKEEELQKPAKTQDIKEMPRKKASEAVGKATGDQESTEKGKGEKASPRGRDEKSGIGSDKEENEKRRIERIEAKEAEKRKQQELVAAKGMEMKLELAARKDRRLREELDAKKREEIRRQPTILGYGSLVHERPYQQATRIIQVPIDKKPEESKDKKPAQEEKKIQFPTPERPTVKSKPDESTPVESVKVKSEEPKSAVKTKSEGAKPTLEKPIPKGKSEESKTGSAAAAAAAAAMAKQSKILEVLLPKKPDERRPEKVAKLGSVSEEKAKASAPKSGTELIDFSKKAGMSGEVKKESDKKEKLSPVREPERKVQGEADKLKIDEGKRDKKTAKSDSNLGRAGDDKSGKGQPTKTTAVKTSEDKGAKTEEAGKPKSSLSEWEKEIASKASSIFGIGSDKSKAKKAGEAEKSKAIQPDVKKSEEKKTKPEEAGKGEGSGRSKFFELPKLNQKDKKGGGSTGSKTPKMDAKDESAIMEARVEQYMKMYEPVSKTDDSGSSSPTMAETSKIDLMKAKDSDMSLWLPLTGAVTPKVMSTTVDDMETVKPDSKIRIVKIIFDDTKKDVDVIVEQAKKAEMDRREQEIKSSFEVMKNLLKAAETEPKVIATTVKGEKSLTETLDVKPYVELLEMALSSERNKMKAQQERSDSSFHSFVDLLKRTIFNAEKEISEKSVYPVTGVSSESFRSFLHLFRTAIDSAENELLKRASGKTGEGDMGKGVELNVQTFMVVLKDAIANAAEQASVTKPGKKPPAVDHIEAADAMQSTEQKKAIGFSGSERRLTQIVDNNKKMLSGAQETKIKDLKKPEEGFATTGRKKESTYIAPHLREVPEVSPKPKRESFMVSMPPTSERGGKEFVIREEPSEIEAIPAGDESKLTHPLKDREAVCIQSSIRSARVDKILTKEGKTGKYPRTILPDVPNPETKTPGTTKPDNAEPSLIECKTAKEPPSKAFDGGARADELRKALTEESHDSEPVSLTSGKKTKGIPPTKKIAGGTQKRDLQTLATAMLKDTERYEPNRLIMRKLLGNRQRDAAEDEEKDDESPPSGDLDDALRHKIASAPYRKTELPQTDKEMSGIRDKTELKTVRVFEEPSSPLDSHREFVRETAKKASRVPCVMAIDPDNPPQHPSCPTIPPSEATPVLPPDNRKSKPKYWWQK